MKMIKQFIAVALMLASLTALNAQSNYGEFRWGLKAGANFASVTNLSEGIEKDKGRAGFVGGAFAKIPLKHFVSIRPELLFHMKGSTLIVPGDASLARERFAMNYVEMPVSIDFDLPYFLDFHAGVQGSLLIFKKFEFNGTEIEAADDNFNNTEFGWHVGTGIDLGNIGIHVRFQQSLTSFYDITSFGGEKVKPRNWGISLTGAYMFAN